MIRSRKYKETINVGITIRSAEKEKLRKERTLYFKEFLRSFGKAKYKETRILRKNLLCFLTISQMPLHYIITLLELTLFYGAVITVITYIVLMILFGLPMYMLSILLGSYSKRGYFSFWKCIPLLKGISYTIMLMIIMPEIFNITTAGLCLLYIQDMFSKTIPWANCDFQGVTNTCLPLYYPRTNNSFKMYPAVNCSALTKNELPTFSAQNYFRFNKQNQHLLTYPSTLGSIKADWAIAVSITWILIFAFATKGFKSFQHFMSTLHICTAVCGLIFFIVTLYSSGDYHSTNALFYGLQPLVNIEFWIYMFLHVCERDEPGSTVYFSSLMSAESKITVEAIIVYSFKLLTFSLLIIWVPILMQNILSHYGIQDPTCFVISGAEIIFAAVPDILSRRMPLPQVWIIIWFLCIYIHCFATALYMIGATVESLVDGFPVLAIYHTHLCTLFCLLCMIANLPFTTRLSTVLIFTWQHFGSLITDVITLTVIIFAIVFIYTIQELSNDYQFVYGVRISNFWINSWKVSPFLFLFETIFVLYYHTRSETGNINIPSIFILSSYIIAMLMLSPIATVMLWKYCIHIKYQIVSSVIQPESGWGYHNPKKRLIRSNFNPNKEVRYKMTKLHCKHQCLATRSKRFRKMLQLYNIRKSSWIIYHEESEI